MKPRSLYPIAGVPTELPAGRGGVEVFDTPEALVINRARIEHLDSLGLPLAGKSVLDVGCGVGHLARYLVERHSKVTCLDGRPENIEALKQRLPGVPAYVARVDADPLTAFGRFDVVVCYDLLYHLENPVAGVRNLASVCDELLLLETVVSDHELPVLQVVGRTRGHGESGAGGARLPPHRGFRGHGSDARRLQFRLSAGYSSPPPGFPI